MQHWGLEVVLESDPLAAARRLAATEEPFALLLTDQTMPGMTGLALARQAQRQRPGCRCCSTPATPSTSTSRSWRTAA